MFHALLRPRALYAPGSWLDSWAGVGDVLCGGDGALAHERDGHRVGAHALARDAAGDVGAVKEQRPMKQPMTTGPGSPMARQIVR
jgi:hypothetical protein